MIDLTDWVCWLCSVVEIQHKEDQHLEKFLDLYRTGRLPRLQFFLIMLAVALLEFIPATMLFGSAETLVDTALQMGLGSPIVLGFVLYCLLINALFAWPATARRLHDINASGWWIVFIEIVGRVPFVGGVLNLLFFAILLFKKGASGENQFGAVPAPDRGIIDALLNK